MSRLLPLAVLLLAAVPAQARIYPDVGGSALGMGGAYVAFADNPTAAYWNPAGLVLHRAGGVFVYGQTTADPEDLSTRLDDLAATGGNQASIVARPADALRAVSLLGAIAAEPAPVTGTRPLGAFFSGQYYGFSVYRLTVSEASPIVDLVHTEPSLDPATGLPFNTSRLLLRSLQMDDYVFSIATDLGDPRVLVGGNVRYTRGKAFVSAPSLFGFPDASASDLVDHADEGDGTSDSAWSFDTGAMVSFHPKLRLGILGKYLGSPNFDAADGTRFQLEPHWRTGLALFPHPGVTLTADLDLTGSRLVADSEPVRDLAVGGQVMVAGGRVALRGGYRDRIDGPEARFLTGGVGIRTGRLILDGAAGYSPRSGSTTFAVQVGFARQEVPPPGSAPVADSLTSGGRSVMAIPARRARPAPRQRARERR